MGISKKLLLEKAIFHELLQSLSGTVRAFSDTQDVYRSKLLSIATAIAGSVIIDIRNQSDKQKAEENLDRIMDHMKEQILEMLNGSKEND